ncbi:YNFM family putative membrane transporter [Pseudoduganella flava]|uniref:MFS transporter n=1 Tax=Pseudoduganella flava TaxID=871742 RepID=A0A562Q4B2_9BURK|nr:MFS transporter [Pseudoduganella flava]QGZ41606.1 MFS transporter [Pseudoduganella flava]TWI51591.1 YNFM family putative membrane transporter [Pseudoduganella flava]
MDRISQASPAFRRTNRALFFGGFSCFALLYSVQPLMPLLAHRFGLSPAQSSLSLSVSTGALAVSLLGSSIVSDRIGRKGLMTAALFVAALMTLLCAIARDYPQLLAARALLGIALGGMPAIAMAYLSEEIEPQSLGLSMGLYISGSAFGGMLGRVVTSTLSDFFSWRVALGAIGVAGIYAAFEFWRSLPPSRHFKPTQGGWADMAAGLRRHFADDGLPWLFLLAFLLMGCFVSAYNFIGFRLLGAPFSLRQGLVGGISFLYLLGIFSSVWAGRLADRLGRRKVLWATMSAMLAGLLLTLADNLLAIVAGMALFTFSFFASHSMTSSWVGRRARAPQALASALYLFFYYLGSSAVGWLCGVLWARGGWGAVVTLQAVCLGGGLLVALRLRNLAPVEAALSARTA